MAAYPDPLALFVQPLNELGASYAVTGAMAVIAFGQPRLTNDVDIILAWPAARAAEFQAAYATSGLYVPPLEALTAELARVTDGHFNVIHGEFALRADFYVAGDDPLNAWALAESQGVTVNELTVRVACPEYVIVRKLEYSQRGGGDKHLRDVHELLVRSAASLDLATITAFAERVGCAVVWAEARRLAQV